MPPPPLKSLPGDFASFEGATCPVYKVLPQYECFSTAMQFVWKPLICKATVAAGAALTKEQRAEKNKQRHREQARARLLSPTTDAHTYPRPRGAAPRSLVGNTMVWDGVAGRWLDPVSPQTSHFSWRSAAAAPMPHDALPILGTASNPVSAVDGMISQLVAQLAEVSIQEREALERDYPTTDDEAIDEGSDGAANDEDLSALTQLEQQPTDRMPPRPTSAPVPPPMLLDHSPLLAQQQQQQQRQRSTDLTPLTHAPAPLDHQGRPYYDSERFPTSRSYVEYRLGATPACLASLTGQPVATLADVMATAVPACSPCSLRSKMLWRNPLGRSVCLHNVIPEDVVVAALRHVPASVYPSSSVTPVQDLVQQMADCPGLDDIHVLHKGSGRNGRRVRLNETAYSQPRRVSWSVLQEVRRWDGEHAAYVHGLFSYSQSYRLPEDWRAVPMPFDIFSLGVACWRAAWHHLTSISQQAPPTGCQLLVYQTRRSQAKERTAAQARVLVSLQIEWIACVCTPY